MAKVKMVCVECGSDDVGRDASTYWDVDAQEWKLAGVYDGAFCNECGGDDVSLNEVAVA